MLYEHAVLGLTVDVVSPGGESEASRPALLLVGPEGGFSDEELRRLETITSDPALWFELPLDSGHLQFLNNREIAHYRSPFTDQPDATKKRHLVRTWHRDWGRPTYDG